MRLFTLPAIASVRGFAPFGPQFLEMTGGASPMALVDIGSIEVPEEGPAPEIRVRGTIDSLSDTVFFTAGSSGTSQITTPGAFDETFALAASATSFAVRGTTNTTAVFSKLIVDLVD